MSYQLTPMMAQYMAIKETYKDCILFFRLGDFYEMFFDDAITASKELEITLTGKSCGLEEKAPMCGVPFHAAEGYITKLIEKGYKVAIGEQVEDPKLVKGLVKREVVRVVTPGTNITEQALKSDEHHNLVSIYQNIAHYGIATVDISTGDFQVTQVEGYQKVIDELAKLGPKEIIFNKKASENRLLMDEVALRLSCYHSTLEDWYFDIERSKTNIEEQISVMSLASLGFSDKIEAVIASGSLIAYLKETQKSRLNHLTHIRYYETDAYMLIDLSTRRNLELTETMREKARKGSLLWVLDKTKTAMGARRLRQIIEQPLIGKSLIEYRQDGVAELVDQPMLREELREYLGPVYDIERLMSRISLLTAGGRDLLAFKQSIDMIVPIKGALADARSPFLKELSEGLDTMRDLYEAIDETLKDDLPLSIREGNIIRDGFNKDVDRFREATKNGKQWLAQLEAQERERTGIKNLKIKYNKVFGYYIEVTNSYLDMVPEDYMRKQTMSNGERFFTTELKDMEGTILGAEEKVVALEYELFAHLRSAIGQEVNRIKAVADRLAMLDAIASLAQVAYGENYVRPQVNEDGILEIKEGRHPVVEKMMDHDQFITNDTVLDKKDHRFAIITGPNMAGKSTYMRQVALISLMAQIGSFVPASSANISICDRIFTRVGASDDLASGQSTFMVEMTEVANILRNGTENSLIILDEIGRGTSTFDGLSIAWAVVEFVANQQIMGAKTLFATHYHELTELEGKIPGVANYCIAVSEQGDDIIFLRKIIPGGANNSYGIQVAKLAGVPEPVIQRAKVILSELDQADIVKHAKAIEIAPAMSSASVQLNLFDDQQQEVIKLLKETDINQLTPMAAINLLADIKTKLS